MLAAAQLVALMSAFRRTQAILVGRRLVSSYLWAGWRGRQPASTTRCIMNLHQRRQPGKTGSLPASTGPYAGFLRCCSHHRSDCCEERASWCSIWAGSSRRAVRNLRPCQRSPLSRRIAKMIAPGPASFSTLAIVDGSLGTRDRFFSQLRALPQPFYRRSPQGRSSLTDYFLQVLSRV